MNETSIESHPNVMMGKPVIAGTRLTVELILEQLAAGESYEQLLDSYPQLTRASILAALDYAANVVHANFVRQRNVLPDQPLPSQE